MTLHSSTVHSCVVMFVPVGALLPVPHTRLPVFSYAESVPVITCSRAAQFCVVSLACVDLLLAVSCTTALQAEQLRKISEMHEEMMANQTRQQVHHVQCRAVTCSHMVFMFAPSFAVTEGRPHYPWHCCSVTLFAVHGCTWHGDMRLLWGLLQTEAGLHAVMTCMSEHQCA